MHEDFRRTHAGTSRKTRFGSGSRARARHAKAAALGSTAESHVPVAPADAIAKSSPPTPDETAARSYAYSRQHWTPIVRATRRESGRRSRPHTAHASVSR